MQSAVVGLAVRAASITRHLPALQGAGAGRDMEGWKMIAYLFALVGIVAFGLLMGRQIGRRNALGTRPGSTRLNAYAPGRLVRSLVKARSLRRM